MSPTFHTVRSVIALSGATILLIHAVHLLHGLDPDSRAVLAMVQRCPFITPDDLAIMLGRSDRSTLARRLAGLRARGLIARLRCPGAGTGPSFLLYSTQGDLDKLDRAGAPFVDGHDLRALLPRLAPLAAVRLLLVELERALAWQGRARLVAASAFPVLWPPAERLPAWASPRAPAVRFDGAGVVALSGAEEKDGRPVDRPFLVLWDEGLLPPVIYAPLLGAMSRLLSGAAGVLTTVPSLLAVCATDARALFLLQLVSDVAGQLQALPPLVVATHDAVEKGGLLGAPWADTRGRRHTLLDLLETQAVPVSAWPGAGHWTAMSGGRKRGGPVPDFAALAQVTLPAPDLAAAAVSPAQVEILAFCGTAPLATVGQVARGLGLSVSRTYALLADLVTCRALLAAQDRGRAPLTAQAHYVLSWHGGALLAARAGLDPTTYRNATGCYTLPTATDLGALASGPVPKQARGGAGSAANPWRNKRHTWLVNEAYLAYRTCAGPPGVGDYALLEWRRESVLLAVLPGYGAIMSADAAQRREASEDDAEADDDGAEAQRLRPDAFARVRAEGRVRAFFVEIDRGTEDPVDLDVKFALYTSWAARLGTPLDRSWEFPPVAVITTTGTRQAAILRVAAPYTLDVRTTLVEDFAAQGPFGCTWRSTTGRTAPPGV